MTHCLYRSVRDSILWANIQTKGKMSASTHDQKPQHVSISPLLKRLAYPATERRVEASEIASAFALIFEDGISHIQTAALLTLLHSTGLDRDAEVIAKCSHRMREAARQVDRPTLKAAIKSRVKQEGTYRGGLVSAFWFTCSSIGSYS